MDLFGLKAKKQLREIGRQAREAQLNAKPFDPVADFKAHLDEAIRFAQRRKEWERTIPQVLP